MNVHENGTEKHRANKKLHESKTLKNTAATFGIRTWQSEIKKV